MTIEELKKERDKLAATITEAVMAFQQKTGVYVSGVAVQTVTTVTGGGGIGGRPPQSVTEMRVGIGISLERS